MKSRALKLLILLALFGASKIGFTNASFSDTEHTSVSMTAGCWAPPTTPTLISPEDNYIAGPTSGWYLHPVMDWSDSSFVCPGLTVSYQYESYRDSNLTQLAYRSGMLTDSSIPANGTPDGDYYWRVRAFDGTNWSDWSSVWHLKVDTRVVLDTLAPPIPNLISPGNNTVLNSNGLTQTWQQVSDDSGGEVTYDYEDYHNANLSGPKETGTYTNSANGNGSVISRSMAGQPNDQIYWRVRARDGAGNTSSWSVVWHFQIKNSRPDPTPEPSPAPPVFDVVLNEILPNPFSTDNASPPNGEWVELYNRSATAVDVNGWTLSDAHGHSVALTGSLTNTGATLVGAHGWLVVYLGNTTVSLNNKSDTVNLYQGSTLIDSHSYTSKNEIPEGKSIARFPDGGSTWYDPIPTPGEPNQLELSPTLDLTLSADGKTVSFNVDNLTGFSSLSYVLTYDTDAAPQGVEGSEGLSGQTAYGKQIILGTCSTGGTCVYNSGVHNFHLTVSLQKPDLSTVTLEKTL